MKKSLLRFRLKGSGWYETDFKSGQENVAGEASAAPALQKHQLCW